MIRRGLTQWNVEHELMTQLSCMVFVDKGASLLVAGGQRVMLKIDTSKGEFIEDIVTSAEYTMMKSGRYICAATTTGSVDFLDPKSLEVIKSWSAHTASTSDIALSGNSLVTCGRAHRPHGPAMLESLAKVYDLKSMQQIAPIPFPTGAAYVQIHPKMSTTSVLGAPNGQLQVIDLNNHNMSNIVMLGCSITHFIMSPSGNIWALADENNVLHLWGSPSKPFSFNDIVQLPEYADEPEPVQQLSLDDDILASAWGGEQPWEVGCLPQTIDPEIEKYMRAATFGQIAPNHKTGWRNQAHKQRLSDAMAPAFLGPKLLSEKAKEIENSHGDEAALTQAAETLADLSFSGATRTDVPWYYMNVKIKYGRYGVADFDFRAYNSTVFSGLETDISNFYLNPLLQLFKYVPIVRNQALHHVSGRCLDENCLFCELGFLFDMLEKATGEVCQATNFLKAFSNSPSAASKAILDEHQPQPNLAQRLSHANSFLLNKFSQDSRKWDHPDFALDRMLTINAQATMTCLNCRNETYARVPSMMLDLAYPETLLANRGRLLHPRFSDVIRMSFAASDHKRGFCKSCRRHPEQSHRRTVIGLPTVLVMDSCLERHAKGRQLWTNPGWLPDEIGVIIGPGGDVICHEGESLKQLRNHSHVILYELVGFTADINSTQGQKSHLVSFIDVAISESHPVDGADSPDWHLFNDFLVKSVEKQEALDFAPPWKTPIVLAYQMKVYRHGIDNSWTTNPDISCLYNQGSLAHESVIGFALQPNIEIPQPGFHLGIDAEFVSLEREQILINIDGSTEIIRPVRQGTGRISALRGSGPKEGVPFIDDYIKINEPIVDHLTQYSGLSAGDLDPHHSTHALQTLKVAYKKLWLLLNLGCTFVGHGLASDFRTINIHIPKSQIVDTVSLFRPPNEKRRLSLRFLAWYFLNEEIQTGNHDSIVDAHTALRLWRKYQEFEEQGVLDQKLMEIYRDGPNTAFKPPAEFEASGGSWGVVVVRVGGGGQGNRRGRVACWEGG
ncbi:uncharacterized protein KY384_002777 [Bacidia gigantensis]|uniref:uncharacterized protein n=1 Tax=Bacidia gigantensis TaxID=2732470 RepID=UPI001D056CE1|nr:uncharacterized protein KY384_002777 [Bacidia gigantensis]KAG8532899.1 hypothetical protein KY384_002777 [Bacidia gigantensis]